MRSGILLPEACRMIARHAWPATLLGRAPIHAESVTIGSMPDLLRGEGTASAAFVLTSGLEDTEASTSNCANGSGDESPPAGTLSLRSLSSQGAE